MHLIRLNFRSLHESTEGVQILGRFGAGTGADAMSDLRIWWF